MTGGVVHGGWEFVQAAYALTFISFALYGGYVVSLLRKEERRAAERAPRPGSGDTR